MTDREASPGAVAGHIVDEEGLPVPGAKFYFSYPGYLDGKLNTQADPEGAFAFMGIPASVSEVSLRVYYDQQPHDFLVAVGEMDAELVVSPSPRVPCTVVVIDVATAQPIPTAEVRLPPDSKTWEPTQGGTAIVDLAEGRWLISARASGYNETHTFQIVSLEEENVFEIELGVVAELHVLVAMREWLGQLLPGENLEEWRTRAMDVFAVAPDMTQVIESSRMEGDVLVFPVGRGVPFAVGVRMTVREYPEAAPVEVELKTEPVLIPEDATGPLTVGLRLGGDCAVRGNISGLVPSKVRISTRGGIPGVLEDGIAMLGYEEERRVSVDENGEFAFSALAPGAYRIAFRRQNLEGDWEKLHEDVLLSAPGEVIDLEWP
ncbi:MAG: hypothetical protein GWP08_08655 [Nitrospiraceae bacterium]|nr:hypothetical protein [Nitrospiraceae bacterium]